MKRSLRKIWTNVMPYEEDVILKVGDVAEFNRRGNPQPRPKWQAEVVNEIRIIDEYEDKEGKFVPQVSWSAIRNYECMVIVVGTEAMGRNDDLRPTAKSVRSARRKAAK